MVARAVMAVGGVRNGGWVFSLVVGVRIGGC